MQKVWKGERVKSSAVLTVKLRCRKARQVQKVGDDMTFTVIDKKTGKEPTNRVIHNIAKKGDLMIMDIDQFWVGEDGSLVLADDCGRITYCDTKRFKVIVEQEPKTDLDRIKAKIQSASVGEWYVGRADGKAEEVVLMDDVMGIIDKYRKRGVI